MFLAMKRYLFGLFALVGIMCTGCSSDDNDTPSPPVEPMVPEVPIEFSASELQAARETENFSYAFFKAVNSNAQQGNVLVSPMNAQLLLAMVANIADENGREEIVRTLGCRDLNALNSLCSKYMKAFPKADGKVKMALANSVWHHNAFDINPMFEQRLDESFGADVFKFDFSADPQAVVDAINKWCAGNTDNIIDRIIDQYSQDMVALLANAMLFKGQWSKPFDAADTRNATFHGSRGNTTVSMMHTNISKSPYIEGDGYSALNLNFGNGEVYCTWLVLPDEGTDMDAFVGSFDGTYLQLAQSQRMEVELALPRFKFATGEIDLINVLGSMGINSIFTPGKLDLFTTPCTGKIFVSQKASIEFNEKGAEAGAVTWAGIYDTTAPSDGKVSMSFDRPFLFFINERQSGACLMAGKITDP